MLVTKQSLLVIADSRRIQGNSRPYIVLTIPKMTGRRRVKREALYLDSLEC